MKKKLLLTFVGMAILAFVIGGTTAYFTLEYTSEDTISAAIFDVEVTNGEEGKEIANDQFTLDGKLFPGMGELEVYAFEIHKNDTEVPVEYTVDLTPSGELFPEDGTSPVELILKRLVDGEWQVVDHLDIIRPQYDIEQYKIFVDWPHTDYDTDFQGLVGNVHLEVIAMQVDEDGNTGEPGVPEDPEDPEDSEGPPYYTGDISFKATPNGATRTTTNKEVKYYLNDDGNRVIEVFMGDDEGDFAENVGDFSIVESNDGGVHFYNVDLETDNSENLKKNWRTNLIDTSTENVLKFKKNNGTYLSIESQELYDWFVE